jgi:hypothetical protein
MRLHAIAMIAISCVCGCAAKSQAPAPPSAASVAAERERGERASLALEPRATARDAPAEALPRIWRGLDLSKAPVSADTSRLPEIWEERPRGSRSYSVRADVIVLPPKAIGNATVYWVKPSNRFYIQDDAPGSSTLHYYGPFEGDPRQMQGSSDRAD